MKWFSRLASMMLAAACCLAAFAVPAAAAAKKDFRAVWVSTVYNLDYPSAATASANTLKAEADAILDGCADMGMTAVILQVRPSSDAIYPSELFPWSIYLTGDQDTAPSGNFDPLEYWISGAHQRGLELHAWINPYRITKKGGTEYAALSKSNPAKQHPEWVKQYSDKNYYYDPGIPEVRKLVVDGVRELLDHYDVDGIHLDDYFYPGTDFPDDSTYSKYGTGFSSKADWRRDNVNQLIQQIQKEVSQRKPKAAFGVSPAGIWANHSNLKGGSDTNGGETYFSHYADTRKWVREGWVDYICPQLYWVIGHEKADYETLARWWAGTVKGTGVALYIGMADYQANPASGSWKVSSIKDQLQLNASIPEITGEVHFRYQLIPDSLKSYYSALYR